MLLRCRLTGRSATSAETSAGTSFGLGVALGRVAAASVLARDKLSLTCVCADAGATSLAVAAQSRTQLGWGDFDCGGFAQV